MSKDQAELLYNKYLNATNENARVITEINSANAERKSAIDHRESLAKQKEKVFQNIKDAESDLISEGKNCEVLRDRIKKEENLLNEMNKILVDFNEMITTGSLSHHDHDNLSNDHSNIEEDNNLLGKINELLS